MSYGDWFIASPHLVDIDLTDTGSLNASQWSNLLQNQGVKQLFAYSLPNLELGTDLRIDSRYEDGIRKRASSQRIGGGEWGRPFPRTPGCFVVKLRW